MQPDNNRDTISRRGIAVGATAAALFAAGRQVGAARSATPSTSPEAAPASPSTCGAAAEGPLAPPNERVAPAVEAMKELEFLVGDWRGPGTFVTEGGEEMPIEQTESVRFASSGELMLVEGRATQPDDPDAILFRAFATARYDLQNEEFMWWAASDGNVIDTPFTVRDNGFTWGITSPEYSVRYTAEVDETTWVHSGEVSMDEGETWNPILSFELTRIS